MSGISLASIWFGAPLVLLGLLFALPRSYMLWTDPFLTLSTREKTNRTVSPSPSSSCIEDIPLLSHHIHSDQENFGLRPWTSSSADDDGISQIIHFLGLEEKLIQSAFRGKRIFFWGDSTMENLNIWLHSLLTMSVNFSSHNISNLKLSDAIQVLTNKTGCLYDPSIRNTKFVRVFSCNGSHTIGETTLLDGTANVFKWALAAQRNRKSPAREGCGRNTLEISYRKMKAHKPDIIVANIGLWWFHFQKFGIDKVGCIAKHWIEYEHWLQQTLEAAEAAGARVILFKTTNRICDKKYGGIFAKGNRMYTMKDNNVTINACTDDITRRQLSSIPKDEMNFCKDTHKTNSSIENGSTMANKCFEEKGLISRKKDIRNYCENGTMNDHGSTHLNQRLVNFVEANRHNTSLALHIFDDTIITACNYTRRTDGRHYHPLNLVRIRLLGNLISCIDNKNDY